MEERPAFLLPCCSIGAAVEQQRNEPRVGVHDCVVEGVAAGRGVTVGDGGSVREEEGEEVGFVVDGGPVEGAPGTEFQWGGIVVVCTGGDGCGDGGGSHGGLPGLSEESEVGVDEGGVAVGCIAEEGGYGVGGIAGEFVEGGGEGVGEAAVGEEEGVDVWGSGEVVGDEEEQLVGEVEDRHGDSGDEGRVGEGRGVWGGGRRGGSGVYMIYGWKSWWKWRGIHSEGCSCTA